MARNPDCPTSQKVFDADMARLQHAIEGGEYVRRGHDGTEEFTYLAPETPEGLASAYRNLLTYGYANGLVR